MIYCKQIKNEAPNKDSVLILRSFTLNVINCHFHSCFWCPLQALSSNATQTRKGAGFSFTGILLSLEYLKNTILSGRKVELVFSNEEYERTTSFGFNEIYLKFI